MPWQRLTSGAWQSTTLTQDEIWQCIGNKPILVSKEAGSEDRGTQLLPGMVREFASGDTVFYRPVITAGVDYAVTLSRDPK